MAEQPQFHGDTEAMVLNMRDRELDTDKNVHDTEKVMEIVKPEDTRDEDEIRKALSESIAKLFVIKTSDPQVIAGEEYKLKQLGISPDKYLQLSKLKLPLPSVILNDFMDQWRENKGEQDEK